MKSSPRHHLIGRLGHRASRRFGAWAALAVITAAGAQLGIAQPRLPKAPEVASRLWAPAGALSNGSSDVELRPFARGLRQPTAVVASTKPGDRRLYVAERGGQIRVVEPDGTVRKEPFLDLTARVGSGSTEQGLLGFAFHPRFQLNGHVYVHYTDRQGDSRIVRFVASADAGTADPSSESLVLAVDQPHENHNGGDVVFGPRDGYLYVALGDGGGIGDPDNRAQDSGTLLGKLLRIDVDGGEPYRVPDDNPFVARPDHRPELWALGLRNPWRISFDRRTHDLYVADVGQDRREEINLQPAASPGGENYGWKCFEGSRYHGFADCSRAEAYVKPVIDYARDEGQCAVTGGYVYRGQRLPQLEGRYVFADFCSGQLSTVIRRPGGEWDMRDLLHAPLMISAFGQDQDGELYAADFMEGGLLRLEPR